MRVDGLDAAALPTLFAVNVVGLMLCCREAARRMSTKHGGKGGAIVNVSSMAGTHRRPAGRVGLCGEQGARSIPSRWASPRTSRPRASGSNSLRPGMVLTEMTEKRLKDRCLPRRIESTIAMGRVGRAEEIADAILWLLSDEASFISGAHARCVGRRVRVREE